MTISDFSALKSRIKTEKETPAVVCAAHDRHTLEGVFSARRDGLISPILVGNKQEILRICKQLGEEIDEACIISAEHDAQCAKLSVSLIKNGQGQILIKGMIQTATVLSAVLNRTDGIGTGSLLSHVAVLQVPAYPKLMFFTDGGMVTEQTYEKKRGILQNAVSFCRFLGYDMPKVACLCAAETVSPHMQETVDADRLKQESLAGAFGSCLVEGPISLDLATSKASAQEKQFKSEVAGDADIFLCPSLAACNLTAKALYGLANGKMAGVILGASVPIVINSRSASAQEKYYSILLCAAMAQDNTAKEARPV